MTSLILAGFLLLTAQAAPPTPKNNPNGTWESASGTKYNLSLSGKNLQVQMVEGTNARYVKYEVTLQNEEEVNTYKGTGYFVTKFADGKECRYNTDWQFIVVTPDRIIGVTTNIVPEPATCGVKEKNQAQLDLKKK